MSEPTPSPGVRFPPPLIFLVGFGTGLALLAIGFMLEGMHIFAGIENIDGCFAFAPGNIACAARQHVRAHLIPWASLNGHLHRGLLLFEEA